MNFNDVTVIIPTRSNLSHLKLCYESLRLHYPTIKVIIGADNPSLEVKEWLHNNSKGGFNYDIFMPEQGMDRVGIIKVYQKLIDQVKTDYVYLVHDDMVFGQHTIQKLIGKIGDNKILSSRRIEPPIYPQTPEKIIYDLGTEPENFKHKEFLELENAIIKQDKDIVVNGFFAPHFFKKTSWIGYDQLFYPQSREDSDLALRFLDSGYELITVWDSVVYHFSGKGSRRKDGNSDSSEWQKTNYKNTRNYVRKWGTLNHSQYILPMKAPSITVGTVILVGEELDLLVKFLAENEPWFDEIALVVDTSYGGEHTLKVREIVQKYITHEQSFTPNNFNPSKIKVLENPLNNDFANQTNLGINMLNTDWVYRHDLDEMFQPDFLTNMREAISKTLEQNPNTQVVGFSRINYLDGKVSNDIPREHWFNAMFDKYPTKPSQVNNPDLQFRLFKKGVTWVGKVHEVPEPVAKQDKDVIVVNRQFQMQHPKNRQKQFNQEQKYSSIVTKKNINKIVYDSVIYTTEGITKHAVEEIKQLDKLGFQIFLLNSHYKDIHGEEFKKFHIPWDFEKDDYVTIVNQPPERWNISQHFKNRIGYLAFEGKLPKRWVEIINSSNIIELWTPSNYCKKTFEESGVTKNIFVVPHGYDPNVWTERTEAPVNDEFTFLAVLTAHNKRKGHDLIAKAFSEEFSKDEKVKLVFKVNKIYNPNESFNKEINSYVNWDGNTNIHYIDSNLSESELVTLFKSSDVYVSASRCEGFGINILNAIVANVPTITTQGSGMDDFVNKNNCYLVEMGPPKWSKFDIVYERAKWSEPKIDSLKKQMRLAYYENKGCFDKPAINQTREKFTWENTVNTMLDRLKHLGFR